MQRLTYDLDRFPLPSLVTDLVGCGPLEHLSRWRTYPRLQPIEDQQTVFHRRFYDALDTVVGQGFLETYVGFLREYVQPGIGEPCVYQRIPTLRVQLPGNVAVGEFHRDKDYGHPEGELTAWVPLTAAYGFTALHIADCPEAKSIVDCHPVHAHPGEALLVDTTRCLHGSAENWHAVTRVSFDARVLPVSVYEQSMKRAALSKARKLPFLRGYYYAREVLE